jgi:hypothetical protein
MKIYDDFEQRSQKWFEIKKLHLSASHATAIRANGKGLETYVKDLVREYYSSGVYEEFSDELNNRHTARGNKFEDMARQIYELETGYTVRQVGFIEMSPHIGVSPDGLINKNGLIEIKCMGDKRFYEYLTSEKIDSDHYNQMQMQLYVTKRKWVDYFVFNPNFTPNYIKVRVTPDMEAIMQIKAGLEKGEQLLLAELEKVKGKLEPNIQSDMSETAEKVG